MMGDAFDMCTDADTDNQADEVYNEILSDIGMNLNSDMKTNSNAIPQAQPAGPVGEVSHFYLAVLTNSLCLLDGSGSTSQT